MTGIRHCGVYVDDILLMEDFYSNVFDMQYICRQQECVGVFDFILGEKDTIVLMSKLITPKGVVTHDGDMIELLQIIKPGMETEYNEPRKLYRSGVIHIAFECNIMNTLDLVSQYHGKIIVEPTAMPSGNNMCFVSDPENNVIELIERNKS